jgi:hypothetical protein
MGWVAVVTAAAAAAAAAGERSVLEDGLVLASSG